MPLSAGLFKSERKNPVPQCPPRLHVQFLTPVLWSRVPNHFLKVTTLLKLFVFCFVSVRFGLGLVWFQYGNDAEVVRPVLLTKIDIRG